MREPRLRSWLLPACLALGLLLSFYDVAFLGKTFLTTNFAHGTSPGGIGSYGYSGEPQPVPPVLDPAGSALCHEPAAHLAREVILRGELPLWNPHTAVGMPFLAEMAPAILFPLQWILLVSDAPWVWDLFIALRLFLSGLFVGLYLRSMGLGRPASLLGAYGYMLCGFHLLQLNVVHMNGAVVLPLLLWVVERFVRSPYLPRMAILSVAVAITVLASTPEGSAFALIFGCAYGVYRSITAPERGRLWGWRLGGGIGAFILGAGISAPLWLPFLEYLSVSHHVHASGMGQMYLPLVKACQIVAPNLLGGLWESWDGSLPLRDPGHAGTIVSLLAVAAFLGVTVRRAPGSFFAGAAIFCVLKIYGFPGLSWLVGSLPPLDRSYVTVFLGPPLFLSLAVLASTALDRIALGEEQRLGGAAALILGLLALTFWLHAPAARVHGATAALLGGLLPPALFAALVWGLAEARRRGLLEAKGVAGGLLLLLAVDMFLPISRSRGERADPFAEPPYVGVLRDRTAEDRARVLGTQGILQPNWPSAFGLDGVGGVSPLFVGRCIRWMRAMMGVPGGDLYLLSDRVIPDLDTRGADLLNLKYIITPGGFLPDRVTGPQVEFIWGSTFRGEILAGEEVGQTFVATRNGLGAVSVFLSLFSRTNRGTLELRIYEGMPGARPLRVVSTAMADLQENTFHRFEFEPVPDSEGRTYAFTLTSPDAAPGNAVTPWVHPGDGYLDGYRLEGGEPADRDLVFTAHFVPWRGRYDLVYDEEVRIFENRRALPRAYVVPGAEWVREEKEVFPRLRAEGFDPRRTVILEGEPGNAREPAGDWQADGSRAMITHYGSNRIRITVETEAPGYLVLLETYFPGWEASVGGERRTIHAANGLFRAIRVEAGRQDVEFRYRPRSFLLGVMLAGAAGIALAGLLLVARLRRRETDR